MAINGNDQLVFESLQKSGFIFVGFPPPEAKVIKQTLRDHRITKADEVKNSKELFNKIELSSYHFLIINVDAGNEETLSKLVDSRRFEKTPIIVFSKTPSVYSSSYKKRPMVGRFIEHPLTAMKLEEVILDVVKKEKTDKSSIGNMSEVLDHYNKGVAAFDDEKLEDAEKEFTACIAADQSFLDGYIKLAEVYVEKKECENALKVLKKAVSIDKNNAGIFYLVGAVHCANGKKDQAVAAFDKGVEVEPENVHMIIDMGNSCLEKNWVDEALKFFNMAKSKHPEYLHTYNRIGIALSRAGKFEEAEKEYNRAMEIDPGDAGVRFNIGMMWIRRKDNSKAADFFKKAIALDPTLDTAKDMLKKIGA